MGRVIEYVATVGCGPALVPLFQDDELSPISALCVVKSADAVPQGFEVIQFTASGQSANLNRGSLFGGELYLCKSCTKKEHGDPITDIRVLSADDLTEKGCPSHYTVITADRPQHICYAKQLDIAPILDIQLISEEEEASLPSGFQVLQGNLRKGNKRPAIHLCVKRLTSSVTGLRFQPNLLGRFPLSDTGVYCVPESIPAFCQPDGIQITTESRMPKILDFILTTGECVRLYGCVLTFYEPLELSHSLLAASPLLVQLFSPDGVQDGLVSPSVLEFSPWSHFASQSLFAEKSICVLSSFPFFTNFKRFLTELYRLFCSPSVLPMEAYLSHLWETPMPHTELIRTELAIGQARIEFQLPAEDDFSVSNLNYEIIFKCLSFKTIMQLFTAVLLERKVILCTAHPGLLTPVAEAILSFLYPLSWQYTYVPVLPRQILGILDAPMPVFVGMNSQHINSRIYALPEVCVFDLDRDHAYISKAAPLEELPTALVKQLETHLVEYAHIRSIRPFTELEKKNTCSAFDNALVPSEFSKEEDDRHFFSERMCRASFLHLCASFLGDYQSYMLYTSEENTILSLEDLFDKDAYVTSRTWSSKKACKALMKTQSFLRYVEQRTFGTDAEERFAFFDHQIEFLRALHKSGDPVSFHTYFDRLRRPSYRTELVYRVPLPNEIPYERITYTSFPDLNPNLFYEPRTPQVQCVANIKAEDKDFIDSFFHETFLQPERTFRRSSSSLATLRMNRSDMTAQKWAERLLVNIYGTWFAIQHCMLHLHSDPSSVLSQCLHLLNKARSRNLFLDEGMFRDAILIALKAQDKKAADAILDAMQQSGVPPSSATTLAYTSALSDLKLRALSNETQQRARRNSLESRSTPKDLPWSELEMTTITDCPSCNYELGDAEVMSGWTDDLQEYTTLCCACQRQRFLPRIRVQYNKTAYDFPYLNPLVLRKETLNIIKNQEEPLQSIPQFRKRHSDLFWNLVWYWHHRNLTLDAIVGEAAADVHIRPLQTPAAAKLVNKSREASRSTTSSTPKKYSSIGKSKKQGNHMPHSLVDIRRVFFAGNIATAMRMFLLNRVHFIDHASGDPRYGVESPTSRLFRKTSMFRFMEQLCLEADCSIRIPELVLTYKAEFAKLPTDLKKVTGHLDKTPGESIRVFRSVFGHDTLLQSKPFTGST